MVFACICLFDSLKIEMSCKKQNAEEYSTAYITKYWVLAVGLSSLGCLGWIWCMDFGAEDISFRPLGWDVEKDRNPAMPRSAL
jgi:hypothetical protein